MPFCPNFALSKTIKNKEYESNDYVYQYAVGAKHGNGK